MTQGLENILPSSSTDNLLLEGKMLQKVEGNLLAGKKKKKDLRMEEDPDNKLP